MTTLRRHAVVAVLAGMAAILSGCPVRETFPSRALVSNARTETVWGHLSRPEGPRLAPAVVLLPACSGIANTPDWSALLTRWGYATLMVDSFGPRRAGSVCDQPGGGRIGAAQVLDAYGALEHLSRQPFVDRARIAVMGWSLGGLSALGAVLSEGLARTSDLRFRAAIAFYPKCGLLGPGQDFHAPVLILVGEKDDFTPPQACRRYLQGGAAGTADLEVAVYPDAYHSFDRPTPGVMVTGQYGQRYWSEFNARARADAERRVKDFLQRHL